MDDNLPSPLRHTTDRVVRVREETIIEWRGQGTEGMNDQVRQLDTTTRNAPAARFVRSAESSIHKFSVAHVRNSERFRLIR